MGALFPDPSCREALEACVRHGAAPNAERVNLEPIPTGKFNNSSFVDADGMELVLRVAPSRDAVFCFYERDMMRQEPDIHALLLEKTDIPVARVLDYDDSLEVIERDYMVMERLPGRPLTDAMGVDVSKVLGRVGECLAQAHGLTADAYGYIGAHHPMAPAATWAEAFHAMWNRLVDDVVATGHYDGEEERFFRELLDAHMRIFDRPVPSSLLHMDVWAQNILVDGGGTLTGLVDWDRALWGDPEIEFAVLDYCGISRPAFWEGYGRKREDSREARVRQVFYLLYEMQKYIVIREGRGHDSRAARGAKASVMSVVSEAFGS